MVKPLHSTLSRRERQIMDILFRRGRATAAEVMGDLPGNTTYSTVRTQLRVLEEKVVVRVGGSTPIPTNTRVIAATNQNLAELVRGRRFREDLYFRLNVVTLDLPPLRERGEDVLFDCEGLVRIHDRHALWARRNPACDIAAGNWRRVFRHAEAEGKIVQPLDWPRP